MSIPSARLDCREIPLWARVVAGLGLSNFAAFMVVALVLGGEADEARSNGGRFYLSSHGHPVVVSEAVFTYSLIHRASALAGFAAASLTLGIFHRRKVLGALIPPASVSNKNHPIL